MGISPLKTAFWFHLYTSATTPCDDDPLETSAVSGGWKHQQISTVLDWWLWYNIHKPWLVKMLLEKHINQWSYQPSTMVTRLRHISESQAVVMATTHQAWHNGPRTWENGARPYQGRKTFPLPLGVFADWVVENRANSPLQHTPCWCYFFGVVLSDYILQKYFRSQQRSGWCCYGDMNPIN
jgi:hypothetical protein